MQIQLERKARKILGVREDAGEKEIRLAYRRLARQYHPDLNGNDRDKIDLFKIISEAYEVLINPKNNRGYSLLQADLDAFPDPVCNDEWSYWDWWLQQFGGII